MKLERALEKILRRYVGVKMFEQEQTDFKEEFFKELFDPWRPVDYTRRSPLFLNAVFEELNLPYFINIKTDWESGSITEGKKYWNVICFDD
jgi:hypothetical protein